MILKAAKYARQKHSGQFRKDGKTPYVHHPARVAARVSIYPSATEEMVAAAFLHDVMEDCGVTFEQLAFEFNEDVAELVQELTNPSKGVKAPRAERKRMDREHIAKASREAKIIKLCDRIDNLSDMKSQPDDFRLLYVKETRLLIEAIGSADDLKAELLALCDGLEQ